MKKNNFIKRALVALTFAVAVAVMVPTAGSVEAQAAAKKITGNKDWKKAPSVKLKKNYRVTSKNKNGTFVKFTAPKAGKYVVTISSLNCVKPKSNAAGLGNFYICRKSAYSDYVYMEKVKTQGGKATCLFLSTPYWYNKFYKKEKVKTSTYLQKRTATINLAAGEAIYINMSYFTGAKNSYCSYNLKITKK